MTKQKFLLIQLFSILILSVSAQFVTPLESISGDAIVTTVSGDILEGNLKNAMTGPNGLISFKLEDYNGRDHKFKAADAKELKIKVDGLAKLEIIAEQSSNISKLAKSNFEEVVQREYIIWQQLKHPKKDKFIMLQLLNPGFDSKIKVYHKPNAESGETSVGGVAISGGEAKAYILVKDGKTIEMTKKDYKKGGYSELFSDCDQMNNPKPDFKEFAVDVFTYDQDCK